MSHGRFGLRMFECHQAKKIGKRRQCIYMLKKDDNFDAGVLVLESSVGDKERKKNWEGGKSL